MKLSRLRYLKPPLLPNGVPWPWAHALWGWIFHSKWRNNLGTEEGGPPVQKAVRMPQWKTKKSQARQLSPQLCNCCPSGTEPSEAHQHPPPHPPPPFQCISFPLPISLSHCHFSATTFSTFPSAKCKKKRQPQQQCQGSVWNGTLFLHVGGECPNSNAQHSHRHGCFHCMQHILVGSMSTRVLSLSLSLCWPLQPPSHWLQRSNPSSQAGPFFHALQGHLPPTTPYTAPTPCTTTLCLLALWCWWW